MHMALRLRVSDFLGIALRRAGDEEVLVLAHRDPSLTIPLCVNIDHDEIVTAWETWSGILGLPKLQDRRQEPAQRRRRRNAIRARRPKFLVRRRVGGLLNPTNSFRGEREIIARD